MFTKINLWSVFPESLVRTETLFYLPYIAAFLYVCVLIAIIACKSQRYLLLAFLVLSFISTALMVGTLGPSIGKIIPPVLLLLVVFMPFFLFCCALFNRKSAAVYLWLMVLLAGIAHSVSWWVWLIALART